MKWETQTPSDVLQERKKIEQEITVLKNQYMRKQINRTNFYSNYEDLSLHLMQLERCLKYKSNSMN